MEFTKIRQGGREYSIAFPNGEATLFGGIVQNATITSAGITALSTDVIVWNVATSQFLLRRGLTFYDAWSASADGTIEEAGKWMAKLTPGAHFYTDRGDGTMRWFYYDGTQMLETSAETNEDVTEVLTDHETSIITHTGRIAALETRVKDLGTFSSVSAGLSAAAQASIAENADIRIITFENTGISPSQTVNILQNKYGYVTTQIVLAEGLTRTHYLRTIVTGDNYSVGAMEQLMLFTKIALESGKLVGYTNNNSVAGYRKRIEICDLTSLLTATADEAATDDTPTAEEEAAAEAEAMAAATDTANT